MAQAEPAGFRSNQAAPGDVPARATGREPRFGREGRDKGDMAYPAVSSGGGGGAGGGGGSEAGEELDERDALIAELQAEVAELKAQLGALRAATTIGEGVPPS